MCAIRSRARRSADRVGVESARPCASARNAARPFSRTSEVYSPACGSAPLPMHARLHVGAAQFDIDRLLDVVGMAFLDHQHGALAGAEFADLLRHQRIDDIEHIDRNARSRRTASARSSRSSARSTLLVSPPITMMPTSSRSPAMISLSLCSRMKARAAGRRSSIFSRSCDEGDRRMREPRIVEARRAGECG